MRRDPDHLVTKALVGCLISIDNWLALEDAPSQATARDGGLPGSTALSGACGT